MPLSCFSSCLLRDISRRLSNLFAADFPYFTASQHREPRALRVPSSLPCVYFADVLQLYLPSTSPTPVAYATPSTLSESNMEERPVVHTSLFLTKLPYRIDIWTHSMVHLDKCGSPHSLPTSRTGTLELFLLLRPLFILYIFIYIDQRSAPTPVS